MKSRTVAKVADGPDIVVYPAAALATDFNERAFVAEINPEATAISDRAACTLRAPAAQALPQLLAALEALPT